MNRKTKHKHYGKMGIRLQMLMLTFEAESVAYTVCSMLGLDTSDYSFGYVAGWSTGKDIKELNASMEVIRRTAKEISDKLVA